MNMKKCELIKLKSTIHNPKYIIYSKAPTRTAWLFLKKDRELIQTGGFTIIELLIVIVVIGILATITLVSYTAISSRVASETLKQDLNDGASRLKKYFYEYGAYPTSLGKDNCPTGSTDTSYCLKPSSGNTYSYSSTSPYSDFSLTASKSSGNYSISNDSTIFQNVVIGTQTWMKYNLNVGTKLNGGDTQTNNSVVEKWCYNNDTAKCTISGGLYQWDEMMQYVTAGGAQGICPTGFHVPTDSEWKTLEMYLGMAPAVADATGWRNTNNEGAAIKVNGASGLDALLTGAYYNVLWNLTSYGFYATSSEYATNTTYAWQREIANNSSIVRTSSGNYSLKTAGIAVRCIQDLD